MIPIGEDDSMGRIDTIELTGNTLIVDPGSIEEVSRYDHNVSSERIDEIDELTSMWESIDVPIVGISDHDDALPMPVMWCLDLHMICLYDCSEALIDSVDIEDDSQAEPEEEISTMDQYISWYHREYEKYDSDKSTDRETSEPICSDPIDECEECMWRAIRSDDTDDEEYWEEERYGNQESRVRFEMWEKSDDEECDGICPAENDRGENREESDNLHIHSSTWWVIE